MKLDKLCIPVDILAWRQLSPLEGWAWIALHQYADASQTIGISQVALAKEWRLARHTVWRLFHALADRGWLQPLSTSTSPSKVLAWRLTTPTTPSATIADSNVTCRLHDVTDALHYDTPKLHRDSDHSDEKLSQDLGLLDLSPDKTREDKKYESRSALAKPKKRSASSLPSDASRLLHQHADRYTARFSQPFPVAWARDTQIYKRLINTYGAETVDSLQARYLSQPLTSFAARRGFSVPQFAGEIAGLAAQHSVRQHLSEEQAQVCAELMTAGLAEATALTLVTTFSPANIRDQLDVHCWRQQQGLSASPKRLEQAIRGQWVVPDQCRRVEYPSFPASSRDTDNPEQDLTKIWPTFANHVFPLHPQ